MNKLNNKKMNRIGMLIMITVFSFISAIGMAQTPVKIVSPVKENHDSAWYAQQAKLWEKETNKDKKNEEAWRNYYMATNYQYAWFGGDYQETNSKLDNLLARMKKSIPNSHTYNYLMYYRHNGDSQYFSYMEKAIEMRPDAVDYYPTYVSFLLMSGKQALLEEVCKKWYESGQYSASLLNYAYNELVCMDGKSVIIANGDVPIFSKLLVKYGKGLFPDVKVLCSSFLFSPEYLNRICNELGIPAFTYPQVVTDYDALESDICKYIATNCKRAVYFSTTNINKLSFEDSLYSEGLVMKYAASSYDNMAITKRNFEKLYLTDYLNESFIPESYTASANPLNLNYIPCFKSLLDFYKMSEDMGRYNQLHKLLEKIVLNAKFTDAETRNAYLNEIN